MRIQVSILGRRIPACFNSHIQTMTMKLAAHLTPQVWPSLLKISIDSSKRGVKVVKNRLERRLKTGITPSELLKCGKISTRTLMNSQMECSQKSLTLETLLGMTSPVHLEINLSVDHASRWLMSKLLNLD